MSWSRSVYSSMVSEIGYDDETQSLLVTWSNGRQSAYQGVPEGLALEISKAPSVGSMINSDVKGIYSHRYLG